jgi:hypothetical protein
MDRAVCVSQDSASTAWAVQQAHYAGQEVPAISVRIACQKFVTVLVAPEVELWTPTPRYSTTQFTAFTLQT